MENTSKSINPKILIFVIILITFTVVAWKTCSVEYDNSRSLKYDQELTIIK